MAKLVIRRNSSIRYLFRVPFKIIVDDKEIGSIYPSEKVECNLSIGEHKIIISSPDKSIEQGIIVEKDAKNIEIVLGSIRVFTIHTPQIREINFR